MMTQSPQQQIRRFGLILALGAALYIGAVIVFIIIY
jgi:uncharacterized protein YjeT (DUF2065 family)